MADLANSWPRADLAQLICMLGTRLAQLGTANTHTWKQVKPVSQHEAYEGCRPRVYTAQQQHWGAVQLSPLQ